MINLHSSSIDVHRPLDDTFVGLAREVGSIAFFLLGIRLRFKQESVDCGLVCHLARLAFTVSGDLRVITYQLRFSVPFQLASCHHREWYGRSIEDTFS